MKQSTTDSTATLPPFPHDFHVSFSHVQLYVDKIQLLSAYKQMEDSLNQFHEHAECLSTVDEKAKLWQSLTGQSSVTVADFQSQNRDIIQQLLTGFGFRITGFREMDQGMATTKSLLLTSKDPFGVQIVVTAAVENEQTIANVKDQYSHFDVASLRQFFAAHNDRQGIAVLGFQTNHVGTIRQRYQLLHPNLIHTYEVHEGTKVLQVYAYYTNHGGIHELGENEPDRGTLLRFVQVHSGICNEPCILPGLTSIDAIFDEISQPAYCDHWVSNVHSRTQFLSTLEDTLGFTPVINFNAGVVAAGEAQIESTVTGNTSTFEAVDKIEALRNQSQVFLPINNALSAIGHVHGFLEEIGQGTQHIASRVENLVDFVERCNFMREATGEGFSFLKIPRSYYGILAPGYLQAQTGISFDVAVVIVESCKRRNIVSIDGAVDLDISWEGLSAVLESEHWSPAQEAAYNENKESILKAILSSRYCNLYSLLRHHVSESAYLGIVRNEVLVDVQGEDILYQIFTCKILHRNAADEAPFLEFIQRVCSEGESEDGCPMKIKPGCGGFGIRNFLTLFLSIEVSKAMREVAEEKLKGDDARAHVAEHRVKCFTNQLNDSNPILTEISNAMTEEDKCRSQREVARLAGDVGTCKVWQERLELASRKKQKGNAKLMACSSRYENMMRSIRENAEQSRP